MSIVGHLCLMSKPSSSTAESIYLDSEETEEKGAAGVETKRKGRKGVGLHTVLGLVGRLRL